ncbi:nucleolar protein, putative [Candida dubliniensis CD36]|uniref:Nucleolar protein, putative n=1 Tax=Candida dubliniensis (strain CD36 / ATCC MYA-646 / CBS 7987 / NCPF 3949 / NRRL Y-17841) TaxID=573826 RepID=B9WN59_CANDC|nr:nucleolar protein, putative [Candida dubliniensis CD36]CAX40526.1 nucleolar protein, putative [Candida dubliniensis CD36]
MIHESSSTMSLIEEQESITLHPKPGFVIKTKILESKDVSRTLTKVFINVCHSPDVPKPDVDFDPQIVFPLIIDNEWEIPIILSKEKESKDKKGFPSLVYDCCINSKCFQWCQISKDLKSILIEWCIESIELVYSLTLEREYSTPKMLAKGELSNTVVTKKELLGSVLKDRLKELQQNETLGLIKEMESEDDELPDLMNINKRSTKPLIEEVSHQTKPAPPKAIKELNYAVSFKKIAHPNFNLAVIVACDDKLDTSFEVTYSSESSTILISGIKFASGNSLEIPVSPDITVTNTKCFEVHNTMYIFI